MRKTLSGNGVPQALWNFWKLFRKNRAAVVAACLLLVIVLMAVFADVITPYSKVLEQSSAERLQAPSAEHPFGTDRLGRDLFARIVHGSRMSLSLGLLTTVFSVVIGGVLGVLCGYFGGWLDKIIMRLCDVMNSIPALLFALAVVAALGANLINLVLAITIITVPSYIRLVRSVVLMISEQEYIYAARICGSSHRNIIVKHIIPNALSPIIVQASLNVASMMLTAAGLSFIGMGVQAPAPEWGAMINSAKQYMFQQPYLMIFPGGAIALTALSLNLVGDGLRDALDPKMRS